MKDLKNKTAIALAVALLSLNAQARMLTVGPDESGSNPLLRDEAFAKAAAAQAAAAIEKLKDGDIVRLKSIGSRSDARNLQTQEVVIGRRMRPGKVADGVTAYFESLPKQADVAQSSTNLISWLEFGDFGCDQGGDIFIATDGVESSALVDGMALLEGKAHLPKAEANLTGCSLTLFGVGVGMDPVSAKRLRAEWTRWGQEAGATLKIVMP